MLAKLMQGGRLIFIVLIVLLVAGLLAVTSNLTRARAEVNELRVNSEALIAAREAEIRRDERAAADFEWTEREKYCNPGGRGQSFVGPDDYGRFGFFHPCNWAVFVSQHARSGGDFEAWFHPRVIVSGHDEIYALRFWIHSQSYDSVIQSRLGMVSSGQIVQSTFTNVINPGMANEYRIDGTRFDGEFQRGVSGGAEVIFRIRDKTAVVRTDSGLFKDDFERLIRSIVFTP
ncbi:hypothetical protein FWG76_02600 [Candidatus Saccharibacteria bacterium]|nr:hypothetical protein [Candidatus Saccharibacteria bacterium]